MSGIAMLEGEARPGKACNRRRKLVVLVHPDTAEIVSVIETYKPRPPKVVERDGKAMRCIGVEIPWANVPVGFEHELPDGRKLIPVAVVSCDGSSKLPGRRIGTRDGNPPECQLESCMEVSSGIGPVRDDDGRVVAQTRGSFRGPPIENTLSQARELVEAMRAQNFPARRVHNPARDRMRPAHCVGRLVRRST